MIRLILYLIRARRRRGLPVLRPLVVGRPAAHAVPDLPTRTIPPLDLPRCKRVLLWSAAQGKHVLHILEDRGHV